MRYLISFLSIFMTLSANAQVIHWITFIDTADPIVGEYNKTGHNVLYNHFINIVNDVMADNGYKSEIHDYHGTSMTPQNCKKIIDGLHCEPDDIILFYYIGHGTHGTGDNGPFPQLTFGSNDERRYIPLQWVHGQLKTKNPSLLITISVCGNTYCQATEKESPMFYVGDISEKKESSINVRFGNKVTTKTERQAIQELFLGYKGDLILTSASPGQHSYARKTQFGLMDLFTSSFVYIFETKAEVGELNWKNLSTDIQYCVHNSHKNKEDQQTPYFECNLWKKNLSDNSQTASDSLDIISNDFRDLITRQVQMKFDLLNECISNMADRNNSLQDRLNCKTQALSLFIANGDSYLDDGIYKDGAIIETISLYRQKPIRRLIRDYFDGLTHNKYSKVEISTTQVFEIDVSDLKRIEENLYEASICYEQFFISKGYQDRKLSIERTIKNLNVYIFTEETNFGTEHIIKFGDIIGYETQSSKHKNSKYNDNNLY